MGKVILTPGTPSTTPIRYRAVVAYDGTALAGWQIQPGQRTIQGDLETALRQLTGETIRVHCSGRTDAGVHARAQVAHFDLHTRRPTDKLALGLNAVLQEDIRIMRLTRTRPDFHARYDVREKEYRYLIYNAHILPPLLRRTHTHVRKPLDIEAMRQAAGLLVGQHDFAAFSANPHREIDGTVRCVYALEVRRRGREICIVARGNGFLYKMVRSLAGFLIRVGLGELPPEAAATILESRLRTARVPTAPPQGLSLWAVRYHRTPPTRP